MCDTYNNRNGKYKIHNFEKSGKVGNSEKVKKRRFLLMPKQPF